MGLRVRYVIIITTADRAQSKALSTPNPHSHAAMICTLYWQSSVLSLILRTKVGNKDTY